MKLLLIACVGVLAFGCGPQGQTFAKSVSTEVPISRSVVGTVTYRPLSATGNVLEVYVVSVPKAGTLSEIIGKQVIVNPVSVSQAFSVEYSPKDIDPQTRYAVRILMLQGDKLVAINTTVDLVITYGATDRVENIAMEPVGPDHLESTSPAETRWTKVPAPVESVRGTETYRGYSIGIVSYLLDGCYKFSGSEMSRTADAVELWSTGPENMSGDEIFAMIADVHLPTDIDVEVTNFKRVHTASNLLVGCSVGINYVETTMSFGVDELQTGKTHKVTVNDGIEFVFLPR